MQGGRQAGDELATNYLFQARSQECSVSQCNLLDWFFGAQYSANCGVTYIYGPPVSACVRACVLNGMEL